MIDQVLDLARRYLGEVKRSGPENVMCSCPFHVPEGGPSTTFALSLTKGMFICFSCGIKGTLGTLLRHLEIPRNIIDLEYGELLRELQDALPEPKDHLRPNLRASDPLPEALLGLFDYCPVDLADAGFREDILRDFEVGFDKTHMRITFPLRNYRGELEGISGRTVINAYPRYKIYTEEYAAWNIAPRHTDRRSLLWNIHRIYPAVFFGRGAKVTVVEGYKACLWTTQAGISNVTALLGATMTYEQQWLLERLGASLYLFLDNNKAGWRGCLDLAARLSLSVPTFIVPYPDKREQPDQLQPSEILHAHEHAEEAHVWALKNHHEKAFHGIRQRSLPSE